MGVGAEIVKDILGATEGPFGVDHPVGSIQGTKPRGERLRRLQVRQLSGEGQLAVAMKLAESRYKFAAEDPTEDLYREEETGRRMNPAVMVGRQSASRNDAMQVRMME